jgi:hypothetical protein
MQIRDEGWCVRYYITVGPHAAATLEGFDPRSDWFIHPANSTDTWIFDGHRSLLRIQLIEGQLLAQSMQTDPDLLHRAPQLVSSRVRGRCYAG